MGAHVSGEFDNKVNQYLEGPKTSKTHHKEELPHRVETDGADRTAIRKILEHIINPLDMNQLEDHKELVNIFTGEYGIPSSNIHEAAAIGKAQLETFIEELPESMYKTISKKVILMAASSRKRATTATAEDLKIASPEVLLTRLLVLLNSGRVGNVTIVELLKFEMAEYPPSMFKDLGVLRTATSKCKLKSTLASSGTNRQKVDTLIVDASAVLWTISWPSKGGLVSDFIKSFREYIRRELSYGQAVYIIFDRYHTDSIKGHTRTVRASGLTRRFHLQMTTELPPQKTILKSAQNKMQLTDLIVQSLQEDPIVSSQLLVLTGLEEIPLQIQHGVVADLPSLRTSHEEADVIIINQMLWAIRTQHSSSVKVICDDTDVFALLIHYVYTEEIQQVVLMQATKDGRKVIDIHTAIESVKSKMDPRLLLPLHALSGCDTVACYYRIGKKKALKVAEKHAAKIDLSAFGDLTQSKDEIYKAGCNFVALCYGCQQATDDISEVRRQIWFRRTASSIHSTPKLESLPPTEAALRPNILRAHYQTAIWRACASQDPPHASAVDYGWYRTERGQMLPEMFSHDVRVAPDELLKLIKCECHALNNRCGGSRCSCKEANLQCTSFCGCHDDGIICVRYTDIADESPDAYDDI